MAFIEVSDDQNLFSRSMQTFSMKYLKYHSWTSKIINFQYLDSNVHDGTRGRNFVSVLDGITLSTYVDFNPEIKVLGASQWSCPRNI